VGIWAVRKIEEMIPDTSPLLVTYPIHDYRVTLEKHMHYESIILIICNLLKVRNMHLPFLVESFALFLYVYHKEQLSNMIVVESNKKSIFGVYCITIYIYIYICFALFFGFSCVIHFQVFFVHKFAYYKYNISP
jgi:hypothetical protein